jgi:transposase-like protein
MELTRSLLGRQTIVGDPERRGDERSEAVRSGGSPTIEREPSSAPPDPEVTARHVRRRFTTQYKVEILREADACVRPGQLGALLRKEGLYSSHLTTWRRQREDGLTPRKRGRKSTPGDPHVKKLEQENRHLTARLQKAEALLAFQKKVSELLQIPLKPFVSDEDD